MGMSMRPTGIPDQEQILEALNKYDFDNKKEEEKDKYIFIIQEK